MQDSLDPYSKPILIGYILPSFEYYMTYQEKRENVVAVLNIEFSI